MNMKKLQVAILAVVLAGVSSASAGLTVSLLPADINPVQTIDLSGYWYRNFFWSSLCGSKQSSTVNGVATPAFCIDVQRDSGTSSDYYYNDLVNSPLAVAGPMGATAAANVEKLWAANYSSALGDNTQAAALQLAIWETVATGAGGYTVAIGGSSAIDIAVNNAANAMLTNLGNTQADLVGLVSTTLQGYVVAVPETTTMLAGVLLLLPLGVSTLRILRKSRLA